MRFFSPNRHFPPLLTAYRMNVQIRNNNESTFYTINYSRLSGFFQWRIHCKHPFLRFPHTYTSNRNKMVTVYANFFCFFRFIFMFAISLYEASAFRRYQGFDIIINIIYGSKVSQLHTWDGPRILLGSFLCFVISPNYNHK